MRTIYWWPLSTCATNLRRREKQNWNRDFGGKVDQVGEAGQSRALPGHLCWICIFCTFVFLLLCWICIFLFFYISSPVLDLYFLFFCISSPVLDLYFLFSYISFPVLDLYFLYFSISSPVLDMYFNTFVFLFPVLDLYLLVLLHFLFQGQPQNMSHLCDACCLYLYCRLIIIRSWFVSFPCYIVSLKISQRNLFVLQLYNIGKRFLKDVSQKFLSHTTLLVSSRFPIETKLYSLKVETNRSLS